MRISTSGERIVKHVAIKIFAPGNKSGRTVTFRAPARHGYTAANIDGLLQQMADKVEQQYPGHEYRLAVTGPARYSFVWEAQREAAAS